MSHTRRIGALRWMAAFGLASAAGLAGACGAGASPVGEDAGADAASRDGGPDGPPGCPVVPTSGGPVEGEWSGGACRYLGIPYAAPPIGELRWRPPQPAVPWTTPRPSQAGAPCAQRGFPLFRPDSSEEDCLNLNVWAPPASSSAPIMVRFVGNREGDASDPWLDGAKLVTATGVVLIAVNSRLGPLGFLSLPELRAEDPSHPWSAAYGIEDQIAALKWIQQHAAAFGGDPRNVTIFGESAGGTNVWIHLASPASAGLFARAISQSGWHYWGKGVRTVAEADSQGAAFAAELGCSDSNERLACLRAVPVSTMLTHDVFDSGFWFVADGSILPDEPLKLFAAGTFNQVPLLLGTMRDEGAHFVADAPPYNETMLGVYAGRFFFDCAQTWDCGHALLSQYSATSYGGSYALAAAEMIGDGSTVCPTRRVARAFAAAGVPAYRYDFARAVPDTRWPDGIGAWHGSDVPFLFGNPWPTGTLPPEDLPLSALVMGYWAGMAAAGDPNGGDRPAWPAYDLATEPQLVLDLPTSTETAYKSTQCDFWDVLIP